MIRLASGIFDAFARFAGYEVTFERDDPRMGIFDFALKANPHDLQVWGMGWQVIVSDIMVTRKAAPAV